VTTHRHRTHLHSEKPQPEAITNWSSLSRADEVEIYKDGEFMAAGRIDMLAAMDGSVLWLQKVTGNDRSLFLRSDGLRVYRLSPRPKNLARPLRVRVG
jgi:hypothetical protein